MSEQAEPYDSQAVDADDAPYTLTISRLTVDKLGVKLYDSASAVVAELIANSYDADAELVQVRLPLSRLLTAGDEAERASDIIEVIDNGHGMTPSEARDYFLKVGRDRRTHPEQGANSREKDRPVMGRKGIGKLAPFGICRRIEVLSAGGFPDDDGYLTTHFYLDFDEIVTDSETPVELRAGDLDKTRTPSRGTTIRLSQFQRKRIPDAEVFERQLARRFIFARPDFSITVEDVRTGDSMPVNAMTIPVMPETRIDLADRPVPGPDGEELAVRGWLALARDAYKNEEMAGVRIYARGKIVAATRDFEQPAGFTGEFAMRSYLVGQVEADWLDNDEGEDLIRTDRQGILWTSEYGSALREWGALLIREIARKGREPRRIRVRNMFLEKADFARKARERFSDENVVQVALDLANQLGGFAAEDELDDPEYLNGLSDVVLAVAPHRALIEAFQEFQERLGGAPPEVPELLELFSKTRLAEMASYGQIAAERVRVIKELEKAVFTSAPEADLQSLLAGAPWLIAPTWSVLTANQTLKTFKAAFEKFWKDRTGEDLVLAISELDKRPDFTLVSVGQQLHIVEIKAADHVFTDDDFERLSRYVQAFGEFFSSNATFQTEFPRGFVIDLVCIDVKLDKAPNQIAYKSLIASEALVKRTWVDFLTNAKNAHQQFLDVADATATAASRPLLADTGSPGAPATAAPSSDVAADASILEASEAARGEGKEPA